MIEKQELTVKQKSFIAKHTIEMVFESKRLSKKARPGQFLHLLLRGHTLGRPISIAATNPEKETVTIVFKIVGSGTRTLFNYSVGETIDVLGPCGTPFPVEKLSNQTIVLLGGGVGAPPLYFLGKTIAKDPSITLKTLLGFQTKEFIFYEKKFQDFSETIIVTEDGSYGRKGFVTDGLQNLSFIDRFYACGPTPMLKAVIEKLKDVEGYISLEEYMGCGIGACYACVRPTKDGRGYQKICQDGPVFSTKEVKL